MTTVLENEMYEWPMHNDTATCEDCGENIDVPDLDDPDADFKPTHWRREEHLPPFQDVFEALCDSCYAEAVGAIIDGGDAE